MLHLWITLFVKKKQNKNMKITNENKNFRKQFAKNIKELRNLAGLSQEELAEDIGIAPKTLSYWENGHNAVTFAKIPLLANALGVPVYRLFIFENADSSSEINNLIRTMDNKEKEVALKMIKLLLSLKQAKNLKK